MLKEINNDNSILRRNTLKVILNPMSKSINGVEYYDDRGYFQIKYLLEPYKTTKLIHKLTDEEIIKAGYLLAKFDLEKFYQLYRNIESKKIKELLLQGFEILKQEYSDILPLHNKDNELVIKEEGSLEFYDREFYITTKDSELNQFRLNFSFDDHGRINDLSSQKIPVRYSIQQNFDENNPSYGIQNGVLSNFSKVSHTEITPEVVQSYAYSLCQSDRVAYNELLKNDRLIDRNHSNLEVGGRIYAADLETLSRKLTK